MLKRKVKQDIRKIFTVTLLVILGIGVLGALVISVKLFLPLLKLGSDREKSIIKPNPEVIDAISLSKTLSERNFIMESLTQSSSAAVFIGKIKDGPKVYFSNTKDAKWQVTSLELILNKLTIDNKKPTLIDLRFDQPIVKF